MVRAQSLGFLEEIEAHSGEMVRRCFQCDRCATGCPMIAQMQHAPNELFRLIQLGTERPFFRVIRFWFCVSCYTCSVRCPNDIDIAHVMDTLRELSLKEGLFSGAAAGERLSSDLLRLCAAAGAGERAGADDPL
jgi:heterodisulfide reductase subunit C